MNVYITMQCGKFQTLMGHMTKDTANGTRCGNLLWSRRGDGNYHVQRKLNFTFLVFPTTLFLGVGWVEEVASLLTMGGGALELLIDPMGVNTTSVADWGFAGVRYQIGRPNARVGMSGVSIKGVPTILGGGKRKGT